jgi:hypothetical protein
MGIVAICWFFFAKAAAISYTFSRRDSSLQYWFKVPTFSSCFCSSASFETPYNPIPNRTISYWISKLLIPDVFRMCNGFISIQKQFRIIFRIMQSEYLQNPYVQDHRFARCEDTFYLNSCISFQQAISSSCTFLKTQSMHTSIKFYMNRVLNFLFLLFSKGIKPFCKFLVLIDVELWKN